MATVHLPECPRCTAGCLISLLRARKRGETFQCLWLLNVKFLLVREHQIGQHSIFHEVQKVSTSFDPHSFMRGCELMALLHLVGKGLEILLKDAAHRCLADCNHCGQFGRRTTEICPQLFPHVFNHLLGSKQAFCPGPVDWMSGLSHWTSWPLSKPLHVEFEALLRWSNYSSPFFWRLAIVSRSIAIEIMVYI